MPRTSTKTTTATDKVNPSSTEVKESTKTAAVETAKKVYDKEDLIPCKSVTNGELIMVGAKSDNVYRWADCDYVEEVEYQDLLYAVKRNSDFVMKPLFLIMDDEFVNQNKDVQKLYENLYTFKELNDILNLPVHKFKSVIISLPEGVKSAIKSLAATQIDNGSFDSVNKIKILDEIFGTDMLNTLLEK